MSFRLPRIHRCGAIFGSDALKRRFVGFERHLRGGLGGLGILALEAAWTHADPWLDEVLPYLEANRDFVADFVSRELPGVRHFAPEGTYLAWLDCRALDLAPSPQRFFLERAKVGLSDGPSFGKPGEGFVRLNFATSRPLLTRALEQMARSLRGTESIFRFSDSPRRDPGPDPTRSPSSTAASRPRSRAALIAARLTPSALATVRPVSPSSTTAM
jgi:cystathionine beta-lyase